MLFIVRFTDKPGSSATRQKFLPVHHRWLQEHQSMILVAGALRVDPNDAPLGALWIVSAESKVEVEEVFKSDPFWQQGVRQSFEIFHWAKAFPERNVSV